MYLMPPNLKLVKVANFMCTLLQLRIIVRKENKAYFGELSGGTEHWWHCPCHFPAPDLKTGLGRQCAMSSAMSSATSSAGCWSLSTAPLGEPRGPCGPPSMSSCPELEVTVGGDRKRAQSANRAILGQSFTCSGVSKARLLIETVDHLT